MVYDPICELDSSMLIEEIKRIYPEISKEIFKRIEQGPESFKNFSFKDARQELEQLFGT